MTRRSLNFQSKALLSILFSTTILGALIYFADIGNVYNTVKNGDLSLLTLALLVSNLPVLIYAFTWKEVFEISGIELSYINSLRVVFANIFVNNVTPFGNIGGEAAVTYIISNTTDYSPGKIFSSILMSSIINFAPLGSILILGLLLTGQYTILISLTIFLSIIVILRKHLIRKKNLPNFFNRIPQRVLKFFKDFMGASSNLLEHKLKLIFLLGITHFAIIFDVISIVIIAEAYGGDIFSPLILLVVPLSRVANYFPTPGGSGSYEAMMIGLLTIIMNLEPIVAISTVITYRAVTYYIGLLLGYIALNSIGLDDEFLNEHRKQEKAIK